MATPTQSAAATEPSRTASQGLSALLSTEPKRATLSVMPRAKASSLVWNHCVTKALCATERFSPAWEEASAEAQALCARAQAWAQAWALAWA